MSFVRPEARAALWRWREVLAGAGLLALGLLWGLQGLGLMRILGFALAGLGVIVLLAGVQRARFRGKDDGRGVVQVTEQQIAYFGPLSGGAVPLFDLQALSLDGRARPAHWQLVYSEGRTLQIPVNARGAEALFDAFASLPGLRINQLLQAVEAQDRRHQVLWRRPDLQNRVRALH